jgi:ankyrin repeat protein
MLLSKQDKADWWLLHWAACCGYERIVLQQLEKGADMQCKDRYDGGFTPLWWAAGQGYEVVVKLLLEKGADVESKGRDCGQTPLSWAAEKGHGTAVNSVGKSKSGVRRC